MRLFWVDLLLAVIRFTPYWIYRVFAWTGTLLLFLFSGRMHRYAMESLDVAYGQTFSLATKKRVIRNAFFNLTLGLADLVFYIARPGRAADVFVLEGGEYLRQAAEAGKGAVVAIAHFGPFTGMLFKLLFEGHVVRVVMKPPRGKRLREDIMSRSSRTFAPRPIYSTPVRACVAACFEALRGNEVVAMPVDQNYGGDGRIFVDFFGRKASTAAGPAAFAFRSGAPLLTAFAEPLGHGRWLVRIEPLAVDRSCDEREEVRRLTQALTHRVEAQARKFPDQWAWMHRRWKTVPKEGEIA